MDDIWWPCDLTPSKRPVLANLETISFSQKDVGLYHGDKRLEEFDNGTIYITNMRIIWVNEINISAIQLPIENITHLTYQNAFFRSSAKIILTVKNQNESHISPVSSTITNWNCSICHSLNTNADLKCSTCGVKQIKNEEESVCPTCTFINHSLMTNCEMCQTTLIPDHSTLNLSKPVGDSNKSVIKLSLRAGGMNDIYKLLENNIEQKSWVIRQESVEEAISSVRIHGGGVAGILKNIEETNKKRDNTVQDSFADLESLMEKASELTKLADILTSKLSSSQDVSIEQQQFQNIIQELGIIQPVTKKSSGSSYHKELAKELSDFLTKYSIQSPSSMYSLCDIFCIFNRARGISLVSPDDVYRASMLLEQLSLPFRLREFESGIMVLQPSNHNDDLVASRILELLTERPNGITPSDLSRQEKISVLVAKEQLLMMEKSGLTCRDDTIQGLIFYPNLFLNH
ncbi:EAP30/Vps36 family-domain-containing protein [Globomyces pollinis-pini]|nr:EAP30/Vps36 family-domain-containing protein [Globomyces pollinis-pini]